MNKFLLSLSDTEKQQARLLWQALMFAPSPPQLESARQELRQAPTQVQHAIMAANAHVLAQGHKVTADYDAFG